MNHNRESQRLIRSVCRLATNREFEWRWDAVRLLHKERSLREESVLWLRNYVVWWKCYFKYLKVKFLMKSVGTYFKLLPALLENFAWLAWLTISIYVQLLLISSTMSIIDTTLMHWTFFNPLSTITLHFSPKASSKTQNKTINFLNIFLIWNPPIA